MRVVITGGLGFIGSALSVELIKRGNIVRIIDSVTEQVHGVDAVPTVPKGCEFYRADVRDLASYPELIDGFDAVVHLAAETGTAQSMYRIRHYVDVNENGTASLIEAMAACKRRPRKVILASSRSVYGEGAYRDNAGNIVQPPPRGRFQLDKGQWELCAADGSPLTPIATPESLGFAPGSVYAATKASQELLLASMSPALGYHLITLRLQNVYGAGQSLQNPYTGIISIFFNRARQGLKLPIYEDGAETRDFVHVSDVVEAMISSIESDIRESIVCNVGSGVGTPVNTLANALLSSAGFNVPVEVTGQFRVGDIRHNWADIGNAARYLNYAPKVSLADGLSEFCSWASGQPQYQDKLDTATEELRKMGLAN